MTKPEALAILGVRARTREDLQEIAKGEREFAGIVTSCAANCGLDQAGHEELANRALLRAEAADTLAQGDDNGTA